MARWISIHFGSEIFGSKTDGLLFWIKIVHRRNTDCDILILENFEMHLLFEINQLYSFMLSYFCCAFVFMAWPKMMIKSSLGMFEKNYLSEDILDVSRTDISLLARYVLRNLGFDRTPLQFSLESRDHGWKLSVGIMGPRATYARQNRFLKSIPQFYFLAYLGKSKCYWNEHVGQQSTNFDSWWHWRQKIHLFLSSSKTWDYVTRPGATTARMWHQWPNVSSLTSSVD